LYIYPRVTLPRCFIHPVTAADLPWFTKKIITKPA
jgi:hypothetical protein